MSNGTNRIIKESVLVKQAEAEERIVRWKDEGVDPKDQDREMKGLLQYQIDLDTFLDRTHGI